MNCRTDLKAMAENGHTENGAAAEKRKAEDDTENGENGANGAKREKVKSIFFYFLTSSVDKSLILDPSPQNTNMSCLRLAR